MSTLPWLVPGVALALVMSIAISRRVAQGLGLRYVTAWVMVFNAAAILAVTLTPLGPEYRSETPATRSCDLSRIGPIGLPELTWPSDPLGNILMFFPLGVAIALAPRSRGRSGVVVAALVLPVVIEYTQLVVTPLGRGCQSADVVDNLTGLVLGLTTGTLAAWLARLSDRTSDRRTSQSPIPPHSPPDR